MSSVPQIGADQSNILYMQRLFFDMRWRGEIWPPKRQRLTTPFNSCSAGITFIYGSVQSCNSILHFEGEHGIPDKAAQSFIRKKKHVTKLRFQCKRDTGGMQEVRPFICLSKTLCYHSHTKSERLFQAVRLGKKENQWSNGGILTNTIHRGELFRKTAGSAD